MTPATGEVMGEEGMQFEAMYIGCRQGKVSKWVELIPIFEVCAREKGYEGGGGSIGSCGGDMRSRT